MFKMRVNLYLCEEDDSKSFLEEVNIAATWSAIFHCIAQKICSAHLFASYDVSFVPERKLSIVDKSRNDGGS